MQGYMDMKNLANTTPINTYIFCLNGMKLETVTGVKLKNSQICERLNNTLLNNQYVKEESK